MSISKQVTVWCDVEGCGGWDQMSTDSAATARREARSRGWTHSSRMDLCPIHSTKLTKTQADKIRKLYADGKALCCGKGKENLRKAIGNLKINDYINKRAYELLGCASCWHPGGRYHESGKKKLEAILKPITEES